MKNHSDTTHNHSNHSSHKNKEHNKHNTSHNHHNHHAMMIADFRKRFWVSLLITFPILLLSPMIQGVFNYSIQF
ncbi:MAG: heavy metal translocating P-type ATPase, partial [Bacteroidota bacterium]